MLIRQFATHTPLLIVFEDLHWAAETSLTAIHHLVRRTADIPVLYLATFRPEDICQPPKLISMIVQLVRDALAQHLVLERLTLDAVTELVQQTMNTEPDFANRLYEHTQGNAFFTIETLRALAGASPPKGPLPVPNVVRDLIHSRLERLSPSAREWISSAAVVGRTFDLELIRRACNIEEDTALEAVDELLGQGFVKEGDDITSNDYMFVHHLVYEAVYAGIHYRRRQRLHRLIGEAMEDLYADHSAIAGALAYHFDASGEFEKALHYHDLAAQMAVTGFAWQEAEEHLGRMLWLIEQRNPESDHPEFLYRRAQILIRRAELRYFQARLTERDADLEALNTLANNSGDERLRLQIKVQRARFLNLDARYEQAITEAQKGLILADQVRDKAAYCYLLTQIGFACYFLGEPRQALVALDTALRMTHGTDSETRRHILHILGYVHFHLGNYGCALAYQQESLAAHQAIGDYNGMVWAGLDMAATFQKMGRRGEAAQYLSQHLRLAQQIGSRSAEVYGLVQSGSWQLYQGNYLLAEETFLQAMNNLQGLRTEHAHVAAEIGIGFALYHLGDIAKACYWLEQAVERARLIQHRRRVAEALIGLGLATCGSGEYSAANAFLSEAVAIARESECRGVLAAGLVALANVVRRCGNLSLAFIHASEAVGIADEIGWPVIQMWGEVEKGLSWLAQGYPDAALEHTRRAVNLAPGCDESWIGTEEVYRTHWQVLQALGSFEAATEAERLADSIIEAKAAQISDPKRQQHYREFASRNP
jgi:predicted ATPase